MKIVSDNIKFVNKIAPEVIEHFINKLIYSKPETSINDNNYMLEVSDDCIELIIYGKKGNLNFFIIKNEIKINAGGAWLSGGYFEDQYTIISLLLRFHLYYEKRWDLIKFFDNKISKANQQKIENNILEIAEEYNNFPYIEPDNWKFLYSRTKPEPNVLKELRIENKHMRTMVEVKVNVIKNIRLKKPYIFKHKKIIIGTRAIDGIYYSGMPIAVLGSYEVTIWDGEVLENFCSGMFFEEHIKVYMLLIKDVILKR